MKKYIAIVVLLFAFTANAQVTANRFFYELTYKPHKDSIKTEQELMVLDITKDRSVYQSYIKVEQDSIFQTLLKEAMKTGNSPNMTGLSGLKENEFPEKIVKIYPIKQIQFSSNIGLDLYNYEETPDFNWKIENETKKVGIYNTQKASVNFGGRTWIAWFSTELPFPDGPYKFYGLPGLIIKIEDTGKNYSWVLNANKTIPELTNQPSMFEVMKQYGMSKELTVTKKQFVKSQEQNEKDPTAGIRQLAANYGVSLKDFNTREIDKRTEERLAKKNNSIEIQIKADK